ncbi:MAG: hypothetical protein KAF64_03420 [Hydrogenophaga sp.]|uniref:NEL-type E3 ubiquitin ligase domain-containing protein n=1 Tax=Hydrogenophaga sp. TaxID=1904254 RepID=UPI0025C20538|nr:NEL-type E3 ubiquitin ligase domain-containing protein [Hydrogenophaga sp.]MBU7572381.1 hypothetical protein [Hydrogenophaga sp.]
MISSPIASITTPYTEHLEQRIHALTDDQARAIGACRSLQEFLPRAVEFLRRELTERNATQIARYLMGSGALPEGLDAPDWPISESVTEHLHHLLKTQRFGCFGVREVAQKTFEKLERLDQWVRELTRTVRQWFPYQEYVALEDAASRCTLMGRSAQARDVHEFFWIVYSRSSHRDARALAQRWEAFCGRGLDSFMGWIVPLWRDGLAGREHLCLMQILDAMLEDAAFRHVCFDLAGQGAGESSNGARFGLLTMQMALLDRQARNGELTGREIYQLCSAEFWLNELAVIVRSVADAWFLEEWKGDEQGIVLNLQCQLHDELQFPGVPIEPCMLSQSDMGKEALRVVRERVRDVARTGAERFQQMLAQPPRWRPLIERQHSGQFQRLDEEYAELVDEHYGQAKASSLREGVLQEQCRKLSTIRDKARADLLSDLMEVTIRQCQNH